MKCVSQEIICFKKKYDNDLTKTLESYEVFFIKNLATRRKKPEQIGVK